MSRRGEGADDSLEALADAMNVSPYGPGWGSCRNCGGDVETGGGDVESCDRCHGQLERARRRERARRASAIRSARLLLAKLRPDLVRSLESVDATIRTYRRSKRFDQLQLFVELRRVLDGTATASAALVVQAFDRWERTRAEEQNEARAREKVSMFIAEYGGLPGMDRFVAWANKP